MPDQTASIGTAALCLALLGLSLSAAAQGADNAPYVRNLTPEIRNLTSDIRNLVSTANGTKGDIVGLSAAARQVIAKSGTITVRETDQSIVLSVASDILFDFDSSKLSDKAKTTLTDITRILNDAPQGTIRVVGHTDSKGSDAYNQELSKARADGVIAFFVHNGVDLSTLQPEGRGESEPVKPNEVDGKDNPDGRAQNRRVEFVLPKT